MKCRRVPMEADVEEYQPGKGLEDGFELFTDVVTKGWIITDNLVKIEDKEGRVYSPYIATSRGRTFICEGDYIVIDADGTHHCCSRDKIFKRYEKI